MCGLVYESTELINAVAGGFVGALLSIPIAVISYRVATRRAQAQFDRVWRAAVSR